MIEEARILVLVVVAAVAAPAALACREVVPRAEALAAYPAPVIATVTLAERVDSPGWNTWRIGAVTAGVEEGASARVTYDFSATLSSDGCGLTELPPVGEKWVLYIAQADSSEVEEAYPLDYVREYDARLENIH
jgi:hypothetical protein